MGVLRGQSRPAVLIEGGYLSNPQEAALIAKPDFRQKLAQAIAGALSITNDPVEQPAFVPQASPIDGEN